MEIGDRVIKKKGSNGGGEFSTFTENKGTIVDIRECTHNCIFSVKWDRLGWSSWSNPKFLEMDKQYYREKRLKKLLDG